MTTTLDVHIPALSTAVDLEGVHKRFGDVAAVDSVTTLDRAR